MRENTVVGRGLKTSVWLPVGRDHHHARSIAGGNGRQTGFEIIVCASTMDTPAGRQPRSHPVETKARSLSPLPDWLLPGAVYPQLRNTKLADSNRQTQGSFQTWDSNSIAG